MKTHFAAILISFICVMNIANATSSIANLYRVNSGIYRGGRLSSIEDAQYLRSLGVRNIINLQGADLNSNIGIVIPWAEPGEMPEAIAQEHAMATALGLGFANIPLNSLEEVTREEDKSIDQILDVLNNKNFQPIFIHCEHGVDRTGLIIALYRVKYENVEVETPRNEWIRYGHNTLHQLFTGRLDEYYYEKVKQFRK